MFCTPWVHVLVKASPPPFKTLNSDSTLNTQSEFARKLSLVSSKRGVHWHVSLSLWHFHNLPLALWGRKLAPVPKVEYCVYWPPRPRTSGPQYISRKKKSGYRRIIQHNWRICANGSLGRHCPQPLQNAHSRFTKVDCCWDLEVHLNRFQRQNNTKHILWPQCN